MLTSLTIENVALIERLELSFGDKLNILSGETGAGKSIIVDSIMLLLGARYDKTILRYGAKSGRVEAVFDNADEAKAALEEIGAEADDVLIVSRKFSEDGKNEIRINGRVVTLSMLKSVMSCLVDIYGQNEYQSLSKPSEHLRIIDFFLRKSDSAVFAETESVYKSLKEVIKERKSLGDISERAQNIDFLTYQIEEIEQAAIKPDEEEEIARQRSIIANSERLTTALSAVSEVLGAAEPSASDLISTAISALSPVSSKSPVYEELYERLKSARIEIDDIAETAEAELENINFDPATIDKIEKRYDVITALKRKYGAFERMQKFLTEAKEELYRLENCDEIYEKLVKRETELRKAYYDLAKKLHALREKQAEVISKSIVAELSELGMENSAFEVRLEALPDEDDMDSRMTAIGLDSAEFYLSPNLGQPLKPLISIISGGEMSRFMLALKVITSQTDGIPTLIFDEIDTGISGVIGQAVAKKLCRISRAHQVLCVTHLPQIAAMADTHFYIEKKVSGGATLTDVTLLGADRQIEEVSRLSGSKDISTKTLANAKEMKDWSDAYKEKLDESKKS